MAAGPLDSHLDLKINALESDRMTYRRRVTCTPAVLNNYILPILTSPDNNQSYMDILMGPIGIINSTFEKLLGAKFDSGYGIQYVC